MVVARQEKLQALRDDLAPGERPSPIVPRTFAEVYTMCEALAKADLAPKHLRGKAMDMTLVVMTGLEVGLPPMASLRLYTTWDGVPRLMAEGVRALILQSPAIEYFEVATCDDTHATWVGKRRGRPEKSVTWTIERAKKAGLMSKDTWQKYTQDLLNARASMQLGRILAPDVVAGMVSREEANDGDFIEAAFVDQPKFEQPKFKVAVDPAVEPRIALVTSTTPASGTSAAPPAERPTTAPAASASSGRSTSSRKSTAPTGSEASSSATSKLDAAVKAVEEKAERPTPAASASTPSPRAATGSTSTPSSADSSQADPLQAAREAVEQRDRWGQPIADPSSGVGTSVTQSSGEPASETPSAASMPPPEDFGAEPQVPIVAVLADTAVAKIVEFEQWLETCANQREMAAGFPRWRDWAREMSDKHKDERFRTTGELAIRMKDSWARRKAQVPA